MFDRLEQMEERYTELEAQLALPEVQNDREAYQKAAKAHRDLESTVDKYREYKQVKQGIADAKLMLGESDADIVAMAQDELTALEPRLEEIDAELKVMLLPKD